jgi:hypothetical protein
MKNCKFHVFLITLVFTFFIHAFDKFKSLFVNKDAKVLYKLKLFDRRLRELGYDFSYRYMEAKPFIVYKGGTEYAFYDFEELERWVNYAEIKENKLIDYYSYSIPSNASNDLKTLLRYSDLAALAEKLGFNFYVFTKKRKPFAIRLRDKTIYFSSLKKVEKWLKERDVK